MKKLMSAFLCVVVLSACGIKRIPNEVFEALPYEAKIELLEAENDLALAVDQLEDTQAEITRTTEKVRRTKDRLNAAEKEVRNAEGAAGKEVATLAVSEAEARLEFIRGTQDANEREEDTATLGLKCAEARYELARLMSARKAKLEGSERYEQAVFEAQVKSCEADLVALKEKHKEGTAKLTELKSSWEKSKLALAKKTFDARASSYVE
jgi:hypothetical protein